MIRFWRHRAGASATEFALIAPILFALLLGGIEFSLLLYTQNSVQSAARDTVRQLAVKVVSDPDAPARLCARMPSWVQDHCEVEISHSAPNDPRTNVITLTAAVPAAKASIVGFVIPSFGDFKLSSTVMMRQENVL